MAQETEVLGENLPQCHFVHHKTHMFCPDANLGYCGGKPATNRLSYGMALAFCVNPTLKTIKITDTMHTFLNFYI
jgi:hypothetical protein